MADPTRHPGSREEDAWLSDKQLERCSPAETEPFQSPVPTRMISNGEYMPHPQTKQQQHVEFRIKELAETASKKLGVSRRQFLEGTGGLAASFIAINEAFGKPFFKVSPVEMYEPAAYAENGTPSDVFVFDDQTHIVRSSTNGPQGLRALAQGPGSVSTGAGYTSNPFNGTGGNPAGRRRTRQPLDGLEPGAARPRFAAELRPRHDRSWGVPPRTVHQSDVPAGPDERLDHQQCEHRPFHAARRGTPEAASNITESLVSEILTGYQTSQCRDFINTLAGSRRALAHGQIYPGPGNLADPAFGDYTQWQIEFCQPDSWKGYNVAFAASASPGAQFAMWRLDDEAIAYPTYAIIAQNKGQLRKHPGFFNICIHKGLSANGTQPGGPNNYAGLREPRRHREGGYGLATVQFHHLSLLHSAELLGAPSSAGYREPAGGDGPNPAEGQPRALRPEHPLVHAVRPDRRRQIPGRRRTDHPIRLRAITRSTMSTRSWGRQWPR